MLNENTKQELLELITLTIKKELVQQSNKKEWLSPNDVEKDFSLSKSTLAKWRMDNLHLPYSKVGKYIKYKRSDIEAFLTDNMIEVA